MWLGAEVEEGADGFEGVWVFEWLVVSSGTAWPVRERKSLSPPGAKTTSPTISVQGLPSLRLPRDDDDGGGVGKLECAMGSEASI